MRLLSVIGTLDPAYGGPVESLRQFVTNVGKFGHVHETLTLDGPTCPWLAAFPGLVSAVGPSFGNYRYNVKIDGWLSENLNRFDAIIVRGIWQYQSFAVRRAAKKDSVPYFVFIHGALDPWFKHHYPLKQLKKWLYWPWAEYRVLRDASAVLFTSNEERRLARESFWLYRANEVVVDYGISAPNGDPEAERQAFYSTYPMLRGKRVFLFLSRLHAKKGCDLLIRAFAQVLKARPEFHLVMAGPDQEGWGARLLDLSTSLGVNSQITWAGMLTGQLKWGAFRAAEAFVLPSHSENFGVVVAEALACGLPVLITDKVNIWREIEADGAGLVEPDTLEGIHNLLSRWLGTSVTERQEMSARAALCFANKFEIQRAVKTLTEVIELHVQRKSLPLSIGINKHPVDF